MMRTKRSTLLLVVILVVVSLVLGCQVTQKKEAAEGKFPITVTDDAGRKVTVKDKPQRIISLAPANTEILFALGLGKQVVGVTTYCDYPREAKKKAKIGDFMNPNIEKIASLKPDLVLGTGGVQQALVEALDKAGITLYVSDPKDIAGVVSNIEEIGKTCGQTEEAEKIVTSMKADIKEVREKVAKEKKPTVFYEISYDPLYTAGKETFVDDIITISRGINVAAKAGEGYIIYGLESLIKDDPAIYIVAEGSMNDPGQVKKRAGYEVLSAVKKNHVYTVDENLVSRPGPRITKGLKEVAKIIQPQAFR